MRLRAQQDREYRESAEADRLAVIRQREEAAEREIAEEEARQAEELAAAQELSRRLTEEDTLRKLRGIFEAAPEPAVGPTVSAVRFQLPSGKKLSRRFGKADTVQVNTLCLCVCLLHSDVVILLCFVYYMFHIAIILYCIYDSLYLFV